MTEDRLERLWAKSPKGGDPEGEHLTKHLAATEAASRVVERRIGPLAVVRDPPRFWRWARLAALLHDAGKAADGFQAMVSNPAFADDGALGSTWRQRHEVLSLGFVAQVCAGLDQDDLLWIATGVVTHHRPLFGAPLGDRRRDIDACYGTDTATSCRNAFSRQVTLAHHDALVRWLAEKMGRAVPAGPAEPLHARTARLLGAVLDRWRMVPPVDGLTAVLLQGAVTMADHLSSAHSWLNPEMPLPSGYLKRREHRSPGFQARAHQEQAAQASGHVVVVAPTGSGKTEAALAWAGEQADRLPGQPRVFYVLPYLASIDAMHARLREDLATTAVGLSHSKAAQSILAASLGAEDAARKARARRAATRLFRERVRVGTPYQLLRGALVGPAHSSVLLDTANSVFVFDELHAYEARRFGWILAMMRLWERLGGRIAITSATLAAPICSLVEETLEAPVTLVRADPRYADELRRHRVHVHDGHLDDPEPLAVARDAVDAGLAVLVIANTVRRAQEIYGLLALAARGLHGEDDQAAAMLLHSRFRTRDRKRKEELRPPATGPVPPARRVLGACLSPPRSSRSPWTSTSTSCSPMPLPSTRCSSGPAASTGWATGPRLMSTCTLGWSTTVRRRSTASTRLRRSPWRSRPCVAVTARWWPRRRSRTGSPRCTPAPGDASGPGRSGLTVTSSAGAF